ncbi:MAG: hypothetical protein Hyperionvirus2_58 [Hyperionvirus sp.]|uniref:Uncharacterized protein n=1 Tax=Hyperionvirus sp. TaxID=2487770 RepID=A0A3G5A604_9VIRU|nr:MAG: hypothetical protein Hyperionvirus2_58 [Hyperionvirus sp.]
MGEAKFKFDGVIVSGVGLLTGAAADVVLESVDKKARSIDDCEEKEVQRDPDYLQSLWYKMEGIGDLLAGSYKAPSQPVMVGGDLIVAAKNVVRRFKNPSLVFTAESIIEYEIKNYKCPTALFSRMDSGVQQILAGAHAKMLKCFLLGVSTYYYGEPIDGKQITRSSDGGHDTITWLSEYSSENISKVVEWYNRKIAAY